VEHQHLERVGEELRRLGHERRQVVEQIMQHAAAGSPEARRLYEELDEISGRAIDLLEHQRALIRSELNVPPG
jgi:hypothetical protein